VIWSLCGELMELSLKIGLGGGSVAQGSATPPVFSILAGRNGFAIDFIQNRMIVNDSVTPANNFDGDPQAKLTKYGTDSWLVDPAKGLVLDAARDFAVAMAKSNFPYDATAIHVYARYQLNGADSAAQRYIFMADNSGSDRFAMYTTPGANFRMVTGDGTSADTEISDMSLAANTEYLTFFGADSFGRSWIDEGGIQTDDTLHLLAATGPETHVGLGGYPDRVLRGLDGHLAEIVVICEHIIRERRLTLTPLGPYFAAEGDSHTFNVSFGMPASDFYPHLIGFSQGMLAGNFGSSGESSAKMLAEVDDFFLEDIPSIATIYAGSNDTITTIEAAPAPTASSLTVATAAKMAVGGWVIINGESREIATVSGNALTLDTPLSTVPVSGDDVAVDTETNLRHWIQIVKAKGVARVVVVGSHYLNFASSGDTISTEQSLRASVRVKQQAAASVEGVEYVDTYAYMRDLIVAGGVTQGDWSVWHQGATNTHLNAAGEQVLADAIVAALF